MKRGGSIDLDLGLSIGARMQSYDKFTYEEETHCYVYTGTQERAFVKYPVLADAHVSFVYRFNSIANKVQGCDKRFEKRLDRWKERRVAREDAANAKAWAKKEKEQRDSVVADSIASAKKMAKAVKEKEKAAAQEKKEADQKAKAAEKDAAKEQAAREKEAKEAEKKAKKAEKAAAKEQAAKKGEEPQKEKDEDKKEKDENNTDAPAEAQEQEGGGE